MAKRKRLGPVDAFTAEAPAPDTTSSMRPPIAAVAGDAAAAQALAEVAGVLESARSEGRLVLKLPLDQIKADHLIRDRLVADADEMTALRESLRARGQQTPIEVVALDGDRYGLISGWRRLTALRALGAPTVLARVVAPDSQGDAYVAMVEENEIRVGLTYYERARIVLRAVEAGVYATRKEALQSLFANVSRAKRSKIGSFVDVAEALDGQLSFPTEIGERLGLSLAKAVRDPVQLDALRAALRPAAETAAAEQSTLMAALESKAAPKSESKVRPDAATPPAPDLPNPSDLPGLLVTGAHPDDKGPLIIEGPGLRPSLRQAILRLLHEKAR